MIVSPRVFLILLVPLLLQGAPTPHGDNPQHSGNQPSFPPGSQSVGSPSTSNELWHLPIINDQPSVPPHGSQSAGFTLPPLREALSLESLPPGSLPAVQLVLDIATIFKTTCWLPLKDTRYRLPSNPAQSLELKLNASGQLSATRSKRIVIVKGRKELFLLPAGTTIIASDHAVRLPIGDTKIRYISKEDQDAITAWCERHWNNWKGLDEHWFARKCFDTNLWRVGDPEGFEVPT